MRVITPVDERCSCGGKKSEHLARGFVAGHGPYPANDCVQFTWVGYIYEDGVDRLTSTYEVKDDRA